MIYTSSERTRPCGCSAVDSCTHWWLVANLRSAAARIGCASWWALDDIATAVRLGLVDDAQQGTMVLPELQHRIAGVLRDIGCPELAGSFQLAPPVLRISLLDCIRNPSLQNEEEFFARLRSRLDVVCHGGIRHLHLTDLSAWEARLSSVDGSFPWYSPTLNRVEVVTFVRQHLRALSLQQPVYCLIS